MFSRIHGEAAQIPLSIPTGGGPLIPSTLQFGSPAAVQLRAQGRNALAELIVARGQCPAWGSIQLGQASVIVIASRKTGALGQPVALGLSLSLTQGARK